MQEQQFDVIVVGAGIAGCTAATLFARRGLNVALVERNADCKAYKRMCTHFIQASAVPTIRRLGLDKAIETSGGIPNRIDFWTRWGWIRGEPHNDQGEPTHGYNIRRKTLDPLLRAMAANTPGVTFLAGYSAQELILDGRHVRGIKTQGAAGKAEFTASLLVGADGRNSRIATLAGIVPRRSENCRGSYFAHYRNVSLAADGRSQMWFADTDVGYSFPNDDGITVLACAVTKERMRAFKADPAANLERFLTALPDGPDLSSAERVTPVQQVLHYPNVSRPPVGDGLALVGDAAGSHDPLFGVGCGWAFQSAEWLVDAAADALLRKKSVARALKHYARTYHRHLAGHQFLVTDYSRRAHFNVIERLMYSAAAKDSRMAKHLLRFGARISGVSEFLSPTALMRAAWVNTTASRRYTTGPLTCTQFNEGNSHEYP